MNIIFFSVAAVSSVASLVTAIYGIYFKDGGTRPSNSGKTAEVSRFAEHGGN